jgi:SpoVK/Ycf46/Vps4 family AAA+-type ATPase
MPQVSSSDSTVTTQTIFKLTFLKFYFEMLESREQTKNLFLSYSTKYIRGTAFLLSCFPFVLGLTQLILLRYQNQLTTEVLQKTIPAVGKTTNKLSWETFELLDYKSYLFDNKPTPCLMDKIDVYSDAFIIAQTSPKSNKSGPYTETCVGEFQEVSTVKFAQDGRESGRFSSANKLGSQKEAALFYPQTNTQLHCQKSFLIPARNSVSFFTELNSKKLTDCESTSFSMQKTKKVESNFKFAEANQTKSIPVLLRTKVVDALPKKLNSVYSVAPSKINNVLGFGSYGNSKLTSYHTELTNLLYRKGLILKNTISSKPLQVSKKFAPDENKLCGKAANSNSTAKVSKKFDPTFCFTSEPLSLKTKTSASHPVLDKHKIQTLKQRLDKYNLVTPLSACGDIQGMCPSFKACLTPDSTVEYCKTGNLTSLTQVQSFLTGANYLQKEKKQNVRLMSGYTYPDITNDQVVGTKAQPSLLRNLSLPLLFEGSSSIIKIHLPGNSTRTYHYPVAASLLKKASTNESDPQLAFLNKITDQVAGSGTKSKLVNQLRKEGFTISNSNTKKPILWTRKTKKTYALLDAETYDLNSEQINLKLWLKNYLSPDNPVFINRLRGCYAGSNETGKPANEVAQHLLRNETNENAKISKSVKTIASPTQTDASGQTIDFNREIGVVKNTVPGYQTWQIPLINKYSSLFLLERLEPNLYKKVSDFIESRVRSDSKSVLQDSFNRNILPLTVVRYPKTGDGHPRAGSCFVQQKYSSTFLQSNFCFTSKNALDKQRFAKQMQFHYFPVVECGFAATRNQLQIPGNYSKSTSLYEQVNSARSARTDKPCLMAEVNELWEPLTPFSWMIVTQLSFGLIALKVLTNLYQDYGKELISYVIDLLSILGDSVEASLDESLKEEFQAQQDGSGARLIRKVEKRFQNIAGIQRILPECSELVWFLRNYRFMKSSGLVSLYPVNRESRFIRSAVQWAKDSKRFASANAAQNSSLQQRFTNLAVAPSNWLTFEKMIPKGILLVGPPGTGKTLLVQAIAGEANVPVLIQSLSLISQPGESDSGAEKLTDLFKRARELSPCIVFIDEIDTLGVKRQNLIQNPMGTDNLLNCLYPQNKLQKKRENSTQTTQLGKECPFPARTAGSISHETNQFASQTQDKTKASQSNEVEVEKTQLSALIRLLVEMDGLNPLNGVIVFGATNRPDVLDPALVRPGRFDKILPIELPGKQKRVDILKLYAKKLGTANTVSWDYFANRTVGLSAADLAAIMNQSTIQAVLNNECHTLKTLEYGLNILYKPSLLQKQTTGTSQQNSLDSTRLQRDSRLKLVKDRLQVETTTLSALQSKTTKLVFVTKTNNRSEIVPYGTSTHKQRPCARKLSKTKLAKLTKLEHLSLTGLNTQKDFTFAEANHGKSTQSVLRIKTQSKSFRFAECFARGLVSAQVMTLLPQLSHTWPKVCAVTNTRKNKGGSDFASQNASQNATHQTFNEESNETHVATGKGSLARLTRVKAVGFEGAKQVLTFSCAPSFSGGKGCRPKNYFAYLSPKNVLGAKLICEDWSELKTEKWAGENASYATDLFTLNRFGYYQSGKAITHCLVDQMGQDRSTATNLLNSKVPFSLQSENIPVVLNLFPRLKNVRYQDEALTGKTGKKDFEKQLISLLAGKASEILFFATQKQPPGGFASANGEASTVLLEKTQFNWDSTLGFDLKFANKVAHAMVNEWYFYSKKVLGRKTNTLAQNHNTYELEQRNTLQFFQELTNQAENELNPNFKAKGYFRNFQASSGKPWWQSQVAQQVGNLESTYTDWYRIYLPDTEESERNQEWTPPDTFYQNQETHLVTREITWNDLSKMDQDFLYQSLVLNSFNQAFQILDSNRPLLDYFTDYLIRYEIMRQDTINKCLVNYRKIH